MNKRKPSLQLLVVVSARDYTDQAGALFASRWTSFAVAFPGGPLTKTVVADVSAQLWGEPSVGPGGGLMAQNPFLSASLAAYEVAPRGRHVIVDAPWRDAKPRTSKSTTRTSPSSFWRTRI